MKKFVYLCGLILLSMNVMAQIDPYDQNWQTVVFDDFNQPNRQFDSTFQEPDSLWTAFSHWNYPSGVTLNVANNHQIYQWSNCTIDAPSSNLKLFAKCKSCTPISCDAHYYLPPAIFGRTYDCDERLKTLYYYSGMIESYPVYDSTLEVCFIGSESENDRTSWRGRFRYGYFEIKCKLPVHPGAFPSFWLWGGRGNPSYYETIDIFEYSWEFTDSGHPNNPAPLGSSRSYINKIDLEHLPYCLTYNNIPNNEEDLTGWHTFSCEWLPERVTFYRDGQVTAEEREHVPSHYLSLKANYAIDRYALINHIEENPPAWFGTDTLFIDYIKVKQLKWDCGTDEVITCQSELDTFDYGVKKSISITSANGNVKVRDTAKMTFRATDSFEIIGPFQTDLGGELTVIIQECPDSRTDNKQSPHKNNTP